MPRRWRQAERGLASGRAVALFPEGRSHSEPTLGALKSGAARLALGAGVPVQVVPVGLTYADKERFRSRVHLEFGPPLEVPPGPATPEAVRALTDRIAEGLRSLTLNLASWEDLPLIQAAESLYVLATAAPARDAERERLFARGLALIRAEQPARAAELQGEVLALQRRLALTRAEASDLGLRYRPGGVARFVLRNLVAVLVGLPLALLGLAAFGPPALLLQAVLRWTRTETDMAATVKLLVALVLGPLYVLALAVAVWKLGGPGWAIAWVGVALPAGPLHPPVPRPPRGGAGRRPGLLPPRESLGHQARPPGRRPEPGGTHQRRWPRSSVRACEASPRADRRGSVPGGKSRGPSPSTSMCRST